MVSSGDFAACLISEGGGEIALAGAATDGDDKLARVLRTCGHLQRGPHIRAGGNADEQALLAGESLRGGDGVLVVTWMTSSTMPRLRFFGTKPAPVP